MTPQMLLQARLNLKGASRDQALVDKFTQIRALNPVRNLPNPLATLSAGEVQTLRSLCGRNPPRITVAPITAPGWPSGTKVEMEFRTTFRSLGPAAPPNRVIRFVRAVEINRLMNMTQAKYTVPGYVCYENNGAARRTNADTEQYFRTRLQATLQLAQWSFDGPRNEFENGTMSNLDTPGTRCSDLPYAMAAEFLIALYDETSKVIQEAGYAVGALCVLPGTPQPQVLFARAIQF